jgi:hypothetical protein
VPGRAQTGSGTDSPTSRSASAGQISMQSPHPVHAAVTAGLPGAGRSARSGQCSRHPPQQVQWSSTSSGAPVRPTNGTHGA